MQLNEISLGIGGDIQGRASCGEADIASLQWRETAAEDVKRTQVIDEVKQHAAVIVCSRKQKSNNSKRRGACNEELFKIVPKGRDGKVEALVPWATSP